MQNRVKNRVTGVRCGGGCEYAVSQTSVTGGQSSLFLSGAYKLSMQVEYHRY